MLTDLEKPLIRKTLYALVITLSIFLIFNLIYGVKSLSYLSLILLAYIVFILIKYYKGIDVRNYLFIGTIGMIFYFSLLYQYFDVYPEYIYSQLEFVFQFVFVYWLLIMYSSVLFKSWRKFFLYGIIAIMVAILIFMKDVKLSFIKSSFPVYSPYYMGLRYLGYPLIIYFFYSLIIFYRSRNRQSKFEKLYENPEADQNSVNITDVFDAISRRDNSFVPTFIRLYPDFAHKIRAINSGITTNEMEVCALLKLGLSTKEIAIATNTSYKSVESARFRIRKKLNLNAETNLITFFSSI